MDRLANAVILAWGVRRWAIAWVAGAVSAFAQAPFFAFFLLWLTMPVLVWLIDGSIGRKNAGRLQRLRPAFAAGWWFGFGYFLVSLWWLGNAFLVEAESFAWALPLGVIALPAGLAILWGQAADPGPPLATPDGWLLVHEDGESPPPGALYISRETR